MKKLVCLSIAIAALSFGAMAKGEKFEKRKAMLISHVEQRISTLTEKKSCLSSAQKKEDIKSCHKAAREKMKALAQKRKDYTKKMKEMRKAQKDQ